jgi:hypothetical protein
MSQVAAHRLEVPGCCGNKPVMGAALATMLTDIQLLILLFVKIK